MGSIPGQGTKILHGVQCGKKKKKKKNQNFLRLNQFGTGLLKHGYISLKHLGKNAHSASAGLGWNLRAHISQGVLLLARGQWGRNLSSKISSTEWKTRLRKSQALLSRACRREIDIGLKGGKKYATLKYTTLAQRSLSCRERINRKTAKKKVPSPHLPKGRL